MPERMKEKPSKNSAPVQSSLKKELWGGEFWTDGYYVATVGERANWDTVEKYIRKQGKSKTELKQLKLFD